MHELPADVSSPGRWTPGQSSLGIGQFADLVQQAQCPVAVKCVAFAKDLDCRHVALLSVVATRVSVIQRQSPTGATRKAMAGIDFANRWPALARSAAFALSCSRIDGYRPGARLVERRNEPP